MLNMIKLDWLGMKVYRKRVIVIPLVLLLYGLFHEAFVLPFVVFSTFAFSANPFAVEEKGKLDHLYLTLPVTRKSVVKARYGLSFIMLFLGLTLGTISTVAWSAVLYGRTVMYPRVFQAGINSLFLLICSSLLLYAIMNLSMFPILFKKGYAKGKMIGYIIPLIVLSALGAASGVLSGIHEPFRMFMLSVLAWAFDNTLLMSSMLLTAAVLIVALSYLLSHKAYAKREF